MRPGLGRGCHGRGRTLTCVYTTKCICANACAKNRVCAKTRLSTDKLCVDFGALENANDTCERLSMCKWFGAHAPGDSGCASVCT